jgi:hypothetical protein
MKKFFFVFFPIIFSLIVLGCPQPGGDDELSVKISNQSSRDLYEVTWNGVSFSNPNLDQYLDMGMDPNSLPPYLYDVLPASAYMTASYPLSGIEAGSSGYIFFKRNELDNTSVRTQEILYLDDKPVVFTITDDTIVVAGGKSGPLGTWGSWYY